MSVSRLSACLLLEDVSYTSYATFPHEFLRRFVEISRVGDMISAKPEVGVKFRLTDLA